MSNKSWPTQIDAAAVANDLRTGDANDSRFDAIAIIDAYRDLILATCKQRNKIVSQIREATRQPSTRIGNR